MKRRSKLTYVEIITKFILASIWLWASRNIKLLPPEAHASDASVCACFIFSFIFFLCVYFWLTWPGLTLQVEGQHKHEYRLIHTDTHHSVSWQVHFPWTVVVNHECLFVFFFHQNPENPYRGWPVLIANCVYSSLDIDFFFFFFNHVCCYCIEKCH